MTAVEIREIEPSRDILDAMNCQMSAERDRRAEVTRAQGEREATVIEAQAQKEAQAHKAQGYAKALEVIHQTANGLDERTMALQYMEMLEKVGSSASTKFIVPLELVNFVSSFAGAAGLMNSNSNGNGNGVRQVQQDERPRISGD